MYRNKRKRQLSVYLLFKNEFQRKMKENKLLGINSFVQSYIK